MEKSPSPDRLKISCEDTRLCSFKEFAGLTPTELHTLQELCEIKKRKTGDVIISAGESSHRMYLILSGAVKVSAAHENQVVELITLTKGDFFGEIGLVDAGPRSTDIIAKTECELLQISDTTLHILAGLQPGAVIQLLRAIGRALVQRLRTGNQKYLELLVNQQNHA